MGRRDIAEFLLDHGATLDIFTASMLGRKEVVVAMLEDDPNLARSKGVHGLPSLFFPATTGQMETGEVLVANGAAVSEGAGGNTPLHGAAMMGRLEMVNWLLDNGADVTATNYEGKTPQTVAADSGHEVVAQAIRARESPK